MVNDGSYKHLRKLETTQISQARLSQFLDGPKEPQSEYLQSEIETAKQTHGIKNKAMPKSQFKEVVTANQWQACE